jgi:hypothetical protein
MGVVVETWGSRDGRCFSCKWVDQSSWVNVGAKGRESGGSLPFVFKACAGGSPVVYPFVRKQYPIPRIVHT